MAENRGLQVDAPTVTHENLDESLERLLVVDDKTRYLSSSSWANIADQVTDLRTLLEDDGTQDENIVRNGSLSSYLAEVLLPQQLFLNETPYSLISLPYLWNTYTTYVDTTLKVFHIPSTQLVINKALSSEPQITKGASCLIAAIKFAAVTALTEKDCQQAFSASRETMLNIYRSEVHFALKNANFLVSQDLAPLQAFILFLYCNRRHEESRATWVGCGIAIRMAEAIGLHRDGTLMKLPVLTTEIRRRVYWELRVLDVACSEDSGYFPMQGTVMRGVVTRMPLNINDSDIGPADVDFPAEREGATDMTVSLLRYEFTKRLQGYYTPENPNVKSWEKQGTLERLENLHKHQAFIESKFLPHLKLSNPVHILADSLCRFGLKKHQLLARYPFFHKPSFTAYTHLRDILFTTSCDILESAHGIAANPELERWNWMFQTYVPWHPVVYLLNELCKNPGHGERVRAWRAVGTAFACMRGLTGAGVSALWRPLEGLVGKAKGAAVGSGLDFGAYFGFNYETQGPRMSDMVGDVGGSIYGEANLMNDQGVAPRDYEGIEGGYTSPLAAMNDFAMENENLQMEFGADFDWGVCADLEGGDLYDLHNPHTRF